MDWKMPDLGEGVQEGEVVRWLVKEGDTVSLDQHLVELMTDKATMEIPSSVEGVVQKILVKEGAIAKVGQTLAVIGGEGMGRTMDQGPGTTDLGMGMGRTRDQGPGTTDQKQKRVASNEARSTPHAAPAVRQLARDLNIDLGTVVGSGPGGRIVKTDLETFTKKPMLPVNIRSSPTADYGPTTKLPLRGLRRKIAENMVLSLKAAAHFTHVDEADFTELMGLRNAAKKGADAKGVKLTTLAYIMKAVLQGLKKFPSMNASLDDVTHEIILKNYYNIRIKN